MDLLIGICFLAAQPPRWGFIHAKTTYKTKLRVQLGEADNDLALWTSEPVEIDSDLKKNELTYVHEKESVENARFSIIFSDRHSEVILDDIKLIGARP